MSKPRMSKQACVFGQSSIERDQQENIKKRRKMGKSYGRNSVSKYTREGFLRIQEHSYYREYYFSLPLGEEDFLARRVTDYSSFVSVAMIKHPNQKQLKETDRCISSLRGKSRQELKTET